MSWLSQLAQPGARQGNTMTVRSTIIASSALLALAACGRGNHNDAANSTAATGADTMNAAAPMAAPTNSNASQTFANAAAASDAFEIETSKLALTNGSSASIKSYAQKMIDAHTASTAKLKTAAAAATPAITPDPALNAEQQHKLDELKKLNGPAFDQAYATEQAAGHQQALDTLRGYAATGDVPQLKSFATGMVPIVAAHLNMAKGLKA
jgi:putative membrane protein